MYAYVMILILSAHNHHMGAGWKCSDPMPLHQGSGTVKVCEKAGK